MHCLQFQLSPSPLHTDPSLLTNRHRRLGAYHAAHQNPVPVSMAEVAEMRKRRAQKGTSESVAAGESTNPQADAPRVRRSVREKKPLSLVDDEEHMQPASSEQTPPARRRYRRRQNNEIAHSQELEHPQGIAEQSSSRAAEQGSAASSTTVVEDEGEAAEKQGYDAAFRKALGLQAKRVYTTAEMAAKLRQRETPEAIIERVLARLTALVGEELTEDDEAEEKGVQGSGAWNEVADDFNGRANEMALGDQLLEVVRKRHEVMRHLPSETQRRRLMGFLQRRGHSWGTARQVLQQLGLMK
ncbi:hypothetical protein DUNSADRAFT_12822 [Dunaliella salina]|uniref:Regulatory protein RecX n=1 Tax=Dunaliella salina TaxID=3046 RepID=A0ABQ7H9N3_DUNSA|nr:hypothetical protein DUNSADRAFT_12822 [Dunaliella salina]|eukprot:KAF5843560.1 hypothetical protein DUNSADRAFT_12822 [Dunaliella salina]